MLLKTSKQNGDSPNLSNLVRTTSRAAAFCATNKTRLPRYNALAIMLVIVCDLPVPGGPNIMKLPPETASSTASSCELSQLTGNSISAGVYLRSISSAVIAAGAGAAVRRPLTSESTMGLFVSNSACECMSFHITNLLKLKLPMTAFSSMSQRFTFIIALRTIAKILGTSTPLSSVGSGSGSPRLTPKFCRSISASVMFAMTSSSRLRIT